MKNTGNRGHTITAATTNLIEHQLSIAPGEDLHYWTAGAATDPRGNPRPTLILLRGHGKSLKPGSYAIQHFLMDLRRLHNHLNVERINLLGHSLGDHIVCRYAGRYPREAANLIAVERLGPPRAELPVTAKRLQNNNPRLTHERAQQLAGWGTTPSTKAQADSTEQVIWAFDARAREVFLGVSDERNFDYWRAIAERTGQREQSCRASRDQRRRTSGALRPAGTASTGRAEFSSQR